MPQRSANFVSVAGRRRPGQADDDGKRNAVRLQLAEPIQDRRALEAELRDDIDVDAALVRKILPGLEQLERCGIVEKGMALGMTGDADGCDAVGLQQPRRREIAARLERPARARDIARDEQHAPDIGFATQARQKIIQDLARGDLARGNVRHRIVTGAPQRGRRLDIAAEIVAGQKGDGDVACRYRNDRATARAEARARTPPPRPTAAARRDRAARSSATPHAGARRREIT